MPYADLATTRLYYEVSGPEDGPPLLLIHGLGAQMVMWDPRLVALFEQAGFRVIMFDNRVCLKWMDHVGTFLQTGKGLQYHETFNDEEWFYYQKAMEAAAKANDKKLSEWIRNTVHEAIQ